jgi:hypothetical protein
MESSHIGRTTSRNKTSERYTIFTNNTTSASKMTTFYSFTAIIMEIAATSQPPTVPRIRKPDGVKKNIDIQHRQKEKFAPVAAWNIETECTSRPDDVLQQQTANRNTSHYILLKKQSNLEKRILDIRKTRRYPTTEFHIIS